MTLRQLAIALAFKKVVFPPGTSRKRFAKSMIALSEHNPDANLTEKQARYMEQLTWQFRRQMPPDLVNWNP